MRHLIFGLFLVLFFGTGPSAQAADKMPTAMEGSYLILQADKYQRVLSLGLSGLASQVSNQQALLGFTAGQGAWHITGKNSASVRIIDFTYTQTDEKPAGPALVTYSLTFSEEGDTGYQKISGELSGKQFAVGQNPLDPEEKPVATFKIPLTGQRITVE